MKKMLFVLFAASLSFADPLSFPFFFATTDTPTAAQTNANNNAVKNIVNGNLTNMNLKANANISQSKMDSSTGWITDRTGYFTLGGQFRNLRSQYGLRFFINDSITYDKEFLFVSDSTDTIMILSNDSLTLYKAARLKSRLIVDGTAFVDSLKSTKGATFGGNVGIGTTDIRSRLVSRRDEDGAWTTGINMVSDDFPSTLRLVNWDTTNPNAETSIVMATGGSGSSIWAIAAKRTGDSAGNLGFRSRTGAATSAEHVTFTSGGNVGIGTTTPGDRLTVNGTTQTDSLFNTKGYKGTTATLSGTASVDSLFSTKGIKATTATLSGTASVDSLFSTKGIKATTATLSGAVSSDSSYATKAVKAARGIFDSIQIGGGTWVTTMDAGGFVMKIYNGADTICNDSVSYYVMNDNVSLSVPLTGEKTDGAVVKYLATGLPDNLRPATAREIFMPCSTTFTSLSGAQTMLSHVRMKIPTDTAAPCTVIVTSTASDPPPSVFLMTSNISYSLN
jgi:hypothetical protein